MTEDTPSAGPENPPPPAASAGALLRQMREATGMDVGVLAGILKVPVQKIEALETDRLEQLPNLTFARALVCSICRVLRANAAEVLARMPVGLPELHDGTATLNQPFRRSGEGPAPMISSKPSKPLLIAVGILLLAAALLALWPTLPINLDAPPTVDDTVQEPVPAPLPMPPFTPPPDEAPAPSAFEAAASQAEAASAAPTERAPASAPTYSAPASAAAPRRAPASAAAFSSAARSRAARQPVASAPASAASIASAAE